MPIAVVEAAAIPAFIREVCSERNWIFCPCARYRGARFAGNQASMHKPLLAVARLVAILFCDLGFRLGVRLLRVPRETGMS